MDVVAELEPSAQVEELTLARSTHCPQKSRKDRPACGHRSWHLRSCSEDLLIAVLF